MQVTIYFEWIVPQNQSVKTFQCIVTVCKCTKKKLSFNTNDLLCETNHNATMLLVDYDVRVSIDALNVTSSIQETLCLWRQWIDLVQVHWSITDIFKRHRSRHELIGLTLTLESSIITSTLHVEGESDRPSNCLIFFLCDFFLLHPISCSPQSIIKANDWFRMSTQCIIGLWWTERFVYS